jgi:hypothetical protein
MSLLHADDACLLSHEQDDLACLINILSVGSHAW